MSNGAGTDTASPSEQAGTDRDVIDADIAQLAAGNDAWARRTLPERRDLLVSVRTQVAAVSDTWGTVAAESKGLPATHPLSGEEWLSGPYAVLGALDAYISTLDAIARGESPAARARATSAPGGRTALRVLPLSTIDRLILSGFTADVWLTPGVTPATARASAGLAQLEPRRKGGVGVVLGAGNITSIPVLDVLYEILANARSVILKLNPTQDPLTDVFTRALEPLIDADLLRIVHGGGDVGGYLTRHPGIAHVHITGSEATFRIIVGSDEDRLSVPITAELGGISPIIVVPGEWSEKDLRFQAEHIATMRLQNSGSNCIAGQVVILSADWPQRDAFMEQLRAAYSRAPERPNWYPGSDRKLDAARDAYPDAEWSPSGTRALVEVGDAGSAQPLETTEYFSPVLGVVALPGTGMEFLDAAVAHANDELVGTLGANVLIDPATERSVGHGLDSAIADLRYGTVAVNTWTALGYLTPTATWGAFPGGTVEDAPSGIGVVHNALLLADVERTVVRGPFRPFPRSLWRSRFSVLPKPPWFVTSRTGGAVSRGLTAFKATGSVLALGRALIKAFGA